MHGKFQFIPALGIMLLSIAMAAVYLFWSGNESNVPADKESGEDVPALVPNYGNTFSSGDMPGEQEGGNAAPAVIFLEAGNIQSGKCRLIRLVPDLQKTRLDLLCGELPDPDDTSVILAFAGAFTGERLEEFRHSNIAGNHVSSGKLYKGYRCRRNTGAFTWSLESGAKFHYLCDIPEAPILDSAAREGGMAFMQEMMIHDGNAVPTYRPTGSKNIFRALCMRGDGKLAVYEALDVSTFGDFINALIEDGVVEAIYTDMGSGWNYAFYRTGSRQHSPVFLHNKPLSCATNFVVIRTRQ